MDNTLLDGRVILVVEDDYMIAESVRHDLETAGATVLGPVPSVRRALRVLEDASRIDAAVLDVNLGDEKSFAIAEALEARSLPFLFATGYDSADIPPEWHRAPIVMKPLRLPSLARLFTSS